MELVTNIYKGSFFKQRHKLNWRAPIVCEAIMNILQPKSLIDIGCATGDLVAQFLKMDIDATGLDGSAHCYDFLEIPQGRFILGDLRTEIPFARKWDVAMSLEVAEHIEPEYVDIFIKNLVNASDKILISVAPPGQEGHHHVNCQPIEYWVSKFSAINYLHKPEIAHKIKVGWKGFEHKPGIKAYWQNLTYFEKG